MKDLNGTMGRWDDGTNCSTKPNGPMLMSTTNVHRQSPPPLSTANACRRCSPPMHAADVGRQCSPPMHAADVGRQCRGRPRASPLARQGQCIFNIRGGHWPSMDNPRKTPYAHTGPDGPTGWHGACPYTGGLAQHRKRPTPPQETASPGTSGALPCPFSSLNDPNHQSKTI